MYQPKCIVVPVEKHGNLEPFVLSSDVQIFVQTGDSAINAALSTIIDQVPTDDSSDLIVRYDSEWNVILSDTGQQERGEIAIVQIAYEKRVYILQVGVLIDIFNGMSRY